MRGMKRIAAGLAAVTLSAGVLVGCGSSGDTASTAAADTTTAAALTKAEYVAAVNAICTKIDNTADNLDAADVESVTAARAQIDTMTSAAEEGVTELKALVPPADLQAAHDALVTNSSESIALSQKLMTAIESKSLDDATLKADAEKAATLVAAQEKAAKELGLTNLCFAGVNNDGDPSTNDDGAGDGDTDTDDSN